VAKRNLILVTGATGAVGPLVVQALYDAGFSIRTFSIDARPAEMWPDDVESQVGDITELSAVRQAMAGVDVVVHMARSYILSIHRQRCRKSTNLLMLGERQQL